MTVPSLTQTNKHTRTHRETTNTHLAPMGHRPETISKLERTDVWCRTVSEYRTCTRHKHGHDVQVNTMQQGTLGAI
jgi:hypothetical protein